MNNGRRCAFITTRPCPVDVDEISLDVCRLCIDAWKTSAEIQALTGVHVVPGAVTLRGAVQAYGQVSPISQPQAQPEPSMIELNVSDANVGDVETFERLHMLDNMFINDGIDAEDYIKRRRELVSQLSKVKSVNLPQEALDLINLEEDLEAYPGNDGISKKVLPLLLIEQRKAGVKVTKIPEDLKLPHTLNEANLRSILGLYKNLDKRKNLVLVQFNGTKLGVLGGKRNKILCMVLEADDDLDDYEEDIEYLTELLSETEDFNDLQKTLSEAVGRIKSFSR